MRVKINDKIYRLKEIESGVDSLMELVEEPKYKDGDFLHSDWDDENITIIYRKNGSHLYYHASKSNLIGLDLQKDRYWPNDVGFRLATESEKKELIDALAEVGKRWNADKKCIEDTPVYKNGDFVYEDGRIMIVKSYPNSYHANAWPIYSDKPSYNGAYAVDFSEPTFRYATAEEKQELIELLRKDGKQWNAEKMVVEDTTVYKEGDFVVSKLGSILIFKEADGHRIFDHAYLPAYGELIIDKVASYEGIKRHATTEEKQRMIGALAERGKRWNDDKKRIEDIPVRKFKRGDKVRIKDGVSSKTHKSVSPSFNKSMDDFIGTTMTVSGYTNMGGYVVCKEAGWRFAEDWLEPYEELKKGDLAIFWDENKRYAIIRVYDRLDESEECLQNKDNIGIYWDNAIKFKSKEQYERLIKGEL